LTAKCHWSKTVPESPKCQQISDFMVKELWRPLAAKRCYQSNRGGIFLETL